MLDHNSSLFPYVSFFTSFLDHHTFLWGQGKPLKKRQNGGFLTIWPQPRTNSAPGSRHGEWLLSSWLQKFGSVLMVLILSSLFACEETQLTGSEKKINTLSVNFHFSEEMWQQQQHQHTFHSMKMIRARSSKPPMMLPIRIHSEMGIARPFSTSSTV